MSADMEPVDARRAAAEARGDLAEQMLPVAAHLACIVHGDGGPEDVAAVLGRLSGAEWTALVVTLAGLVSPDVPLREALAWLTHDEHGQPLDEAPPVGTVRTAARRYRSGQPASAYVDHAAVQRALEGERIDLCGAERSAAIALAARRGWSYEQIATTLGMKTDSVKRNWENTKTRAVARGERRPRRPDAFVGVEERRQAGLQKAQAARVAGATSEDYNTAA